MSDLVVELRTGRGVNEGPMRDAWVHAKMQEAAARIERLEAALREGVYEATHLSPENEDGSHWAKMSKAWLEQARAALEET